MSIRNLDVLSYGLISYVYIESIENGRDWKALVKKGNMDSA